MRDLASKWSARSLALTVGLNLLEDVDPGSRRLMPRQRVLMKVSEETEQAVRRQLLRLGVAPELVEDLMQKV